MSTRLASWRGMQNPAASLTNLSRWEHTPNNLSRPTEGLLASYLSKLSGPARNSLIRAWLRIQGVKWRGASPAVTGWPLPRVRLHKDQDSSIEIGSHCRFGAGVKLHAFDGGRIQFGDFVSLNDGGSIIATSAVLIGDRTRMAAGVTILDDNFHALSPLKHRSGEPVLIGRNVWLATQTIVLSGVTIGNHTVVSAGSVVTRSLPDRAIAAGNPARIVGRIDCPDDWIRP